MKRLIVILTLLQTISSCSVFYESIDQKKYSIRSYELDFWGLPKPVRNCVIKNYGKIHDHAISLDPENPIKKWFHSSEVVFTRHGFGHYIHYSNQRLFTEKTSYKIFYQQSMYTGFYAPNFFKRKYVCTPLNEKKFEAPEKREFYSFLNIYTNGNDGQLQITDLWKEKVRVRSNINSMYENEVLRFSVTSSTDSCLVEGSTIPKGNKGLDMLLKKRPDTIFISNVEFIDDNEQFHIDTTRIKISIIYNSNEYGYPCCLDTEVECLGKEYVEIVVNDFTQDTIQVKMEKDKCYYVGFEENDAECFFNQLTELDGSKHGKMLDILTDNSKRFNITGLTGLFKISSRTHSCEEYSRSNTYTKHLLLSN